MTDFKNFSIGDIQVSSKNDAIVLENRKLKTFIRIPKNVFNEIIKKLQPTSFFVLHYTSGTIEFCGPFANTDTAREHARKLFDSDEYDPESDSLHLLSNTSGEIDITDYSESELCEGVGDDDEESL